MRLKGLLKKVIGCLLYNRITPIQMPDVSVSRVKGREKLGKSKTRADIRASLSPLKVCWASGNHSNGSFVINLVSRATMDS